MKKLTQALFLALVVAAPVAISAPQVQAKTVPPQQQIVTASPKQQLTANTPGTNSRPRKRIRRLHKH